MTRGQGAGRRMLSGSPFGFSMSYIGPLLDEIAGGGGKFGGGVHGDGTVPRGEGFANVRQCRRHVALRRFRYA